MGKKGGKRRNSPDAAVESSEPILPAIPEEDLEVSDRPPTSDRKRSSSNKGAKSQTSVGKSKSILKRSLEKSDERVARADADTDKSTTFIIAQSSKSEVDSIHISLEEQADEGEIEKGEKGEKGKKTKKVKAEAPDDEGVIKEKKGKKEKKKKDEVDDKDKEKKSKKGKKGKSKEDLADESVQSVSTKNDEAMKKGKKEKTDKVAQTEDTEKKKKKGKGKKDKKEATTETGTQNDDEQRRSDLHEVALGVTESKLRDRQSRVSFHSISAMERSKSMNQEIDGAKTGGIEEGAKTRRKKSKSKMDTSHSLIGFDQGQSKSRLGSSITKKKRKSTLKQSDSITSGGSRRLTRSLSASGMSTDTDLSSTSSSESGRLEKQDGGKKKKGKRGKSDKKQKKEKVEEKKEEESAEAAAQREALKKAKIVEAKAAKKAAKEAAKKAAQQEAAAALMIKAEKPGQNMDYEDLKLMVEGLKGIAKELGIEEAKYDEGDVKGPKKKVSKKEKARLTAEIAEKQRLEMEAQAKRLEELIRKKKEEDRLAAIERDKRDTFEHGLRVEQLKASFAMIQDIVATNADLVTKEKELLEWQKYVECGSLPNPTMCDEMNTYLHLWELVMNETSIDLASKMTKDAIKLLNDLDEQINMMGEEDDRRLENWKWVRRLFREYQASSLDVATYRLLRDVEHNLNRINIPTADFKFQDDHVTLCIWLRVMLPIPLPNPRRPPKPRIEISFELMNVNALFPITIDCQDAAIRAMYLKYDHLSDLCDSFDMPEVPKDYHMDLFGISKKEWRIMQKYKYDNRDKIKPKSRQASIVEVPQDGAPSPEIPDNPEQKPDGQETAEEEKKETIEELEVDASGDEDIPIVPFKQLKPSANDYAVEVEDQMYNDTRTNLLITVPEHVINLRKFVILGGVYHLHMLAQPPQPQEFITMEMTITGLYLPKKLEILPFKVVYTPYIPPEPEPTATEGTTSTTSLARKLPEEIEEEMKKQEEELDKLIAINIKWPQHVIFLELPIVCRWDEEKNHWSKEEIHDLKHNEEQCILSFRTGVFGIYGMAAYRYSNLPFQAYDIKPEADESVTVQLTAAILMLEFNIKDGLISITQLQNSPNMTLQDVVGKYFKLHQLKKMMKEAGIDIFPSFDAFCYVNGSCEKQWAMEKHLYYNMAQISNVCNFAWSRWNLQTGRRRIVLQMRQYSVDMKKQKSHQMLLVTPLKAAFIECTEVSQTFSDKEIESLKFSADLYQLMRNTSGIFVRNKIVKACKQNVYALAQFLIAIRVLSFS